ncbi:hypothetical protein [Lentzea guizhouensis]|nr:hypothetical protein [Lentzea guizhouensis]
MAVTLSTPTQAALAQEIRPHDPQKLKSVPGKAVEVTPPATSSIAEQRGTPDVVWPSAGGGEVSLAAAQTAQAAHTAQTAQVGALPISVAGVDAASPAKVKLDVLGRDQNRLLFRLSSTDAAKTTGKVAVTIDYSKFRHAYGGDWASRLRIVGGDGASTGPVRNDVARGRLTGEVPASAQGGTFALAAAPEGPAGDYKATSLSPSGEWKVSAQTGAFSWQYPLRTPEAPGGLAPELSVGYNSGSVDGRVATTNNQTSSLGEGWNLSAGSVERRFKGCADDLGGNNGDTKTADLCWFNDNVSISLGGRSGELVEVAEDSWRLKDDDGSKIDKVGSAWRLTTTDGTQYFFGRHEVPGRGATNSVLSVPVAGNHKGEPCFKEGDFTGSFCAQPYRWNLDYVVDAHGNTMIYTYEKQTNKYARNAGKATDVYDRASELRFVEYGTREGVAGKAPVQVEFTSDDRCAPGSNCEQKTPQSWPDVPWDRDCTAATCGDLYAPTFWTTKRLAKVTTRVLAGTEHRDVEKWEFDHTFPAPGDGTSPAMWLNSIVHTGLSGGEAKTPAVTFVPDPEARANRVNSAPDGLPPGNKHRIHAINTETGGLIDVNYQAVSCKAGQFPVPDNNSALCYPVRWTPEKQGPFDDWYHKYVTASVGLVDRVGGAPTQFTHYAYDGGGAWAYRDDPFTKEEHRTWNDWRGFAKVSVLNGDPTNTGSPIQSETVHRYFRGMHGDKTKAGGTKSVQVDGINDDPQLRGFQREEIVLNGKGGTEMNAAVHKPWSKHTGTAGNLRSFMVDTESTTTRTTRKDSTPRRTEKTTTFDDHGMPAKVNDRGDVDNPNDDQCTTTTYKRDTAKWLLDLPGQVSTIGVACGGTPSFPRDAISDVINHYDAAGNLTEVESLESHNGTAKHRTTTRTTYDGYGRVREVFDALDRRTATTYAPDTGLPATVTETNPIGHTVVKTMDNAWNQPTTVVSASGARTDVKFDPLGRITDTWTPGRSKARGDGPSVRFAYGIRNDGATWVNTQTLKANGNYVSGYELYDGFLRSRQTQQPSPQGGRALTDVLYDTRGLAAVKNAGYYNSDSAPGTVLFAPEDAQIPTQTITVHDGAERAVEEVYEKLGQAQWKTTTAHHGDHTVVTPPAGGTPTTTFTDARGQVTEVRQHRSAGDPHDPPCLHQGR